ncbi:MAG TPA: ribose-5-phosphate isomerase RpiA [Candidatus Cybelea sp.]|nr:ribose-5-phosphate isomerase RpiA [Candidatus Cybelea sp.]
MIPAEQDRLKKAAAEAAARLVEAGMVVGLGSGTTATLFLSALAERIADGLQIVGMATSVETEQRARALKIPLTTFAERSQIDLTVDGADEILLGSLALIKGHGGALLREKIVASISKRMAVVADETKIVDRLGSLVAVPVEIVPFGWEATARKLRDLGADASMRLTADGKPYVTDGGHYIMNCAFGPLDEAEDIARRLDHTVGVVEHGLFLGFATEAIVAGREGLRKFHKAA